MLQTCFVVCKVSLPGNSGEPPSNELERWISSSPLHFFVRYSFASLEVDSWGDKHQLEPREVTVCKSCNADELAQKRDSETFSKQLQRDDNLLRAIDVFGGCGAFGLGLAEGSQCIKVTHAIEISPSAAHAHKLRLSQGLPSCGSSPLTD